MQIFELNNLEINKIYLKIQNEIELKFNNKLKNKIKIGIYTYGFRNGGLQKLTSLIIKYFLREKIYDLYIYTKIPKENNEYLTPKELKRKMINKPQLPNLIIQTIKDHIDILIYNFHNSTEIQLLNKLTTSKIIFYIHQSFLYWIYFDYISFISLYKSYQSSKYFFYFCYFFFFILFFVCINMRL